MFFIAFSITTGFATSTGYCPVEFKTRKEAEAEKIRLEKEAKDGVRTIFVILGDEDHEHRVPGWNAACRQCEEEADEESAKKRFKELQHRLERKGNKHRRSKTAELISPVGLLLQARKEERRSDQWKLVERAVAVAGNRSGLVDRIIQRAGLPTRPVLTKKEWEQAGESYRSWASEPPYPLSWDQKQVRDRQVEKYRKLFFDTEVEE